MRTTIITVLLLGLASVADAEPAAETDAGYWDSTTCPEHLKRSSASCLFKEGVEYTDGSQIWATTLRIGSIRNGQEADVKLRRVTVVDGTCPAGLFIWHGLCLSNEDIARTSRKSPMTRCVRLDRKTRCIITK